MPQEGEALAGPAGDHPAPPAATDPAAALAQRRDELLRVVLQRGYRRLEQPVRLASGQLSRDFVDAKRALAHGDDLALACSALLALTEARGADFDAVGGLTLGADQFAHGVAILGRKRWFVVRKQPKGRGTDQLVEGADVGRGTRVLLVDDVVSTGGSIRRAHEAVAETGATVVFASALVDRGESTAAFFVSVGVAYEALLTYRDLRIDPVGGGG